MCEPPPGSCFFYNLNLSDTNCMIDIHSEALKTGNVPFHEFLNIYKPSSKTVYAIVEGKDDPSFYRCHIERLLPPGWQLECISSGGKRSVLQAYSFMDWSIYNKHRICFFIDRDLSDFLEEQPPLEFNVYVTDMYSIESEIVNEDIYRQLLEDFYSIPLKNSEDLALVKSLLNKNIRLFCESLTRLMIQVFIWRSKGFPVELDALSFGSYFAFHHAELILLSDMSNQRKFLETASKQVKGTPSPDNEIDEVIQNLKNRGIQISFRHIRGKYLLWCFWHTANAVWSLSDQLISSCRSRPKRKLTTSIANLIVAVAPRAVCPNSLYEFIIYNFIFFIKTEWHPQTN